MKEYKEWLTSLGDLEQIERANCHNKNLTDGFHTFADLYYQRSVLFAALVNEHREISWKSLKHEHGDECFGGGWFIVGIDTPTGSYTYHFRTSLWNMFDCPELKRGKEWDGHTSSAVTRLLSLGVNLSENIDPDKIVRSTDRCVTIDVSRPGFKYHDEFISEFIAQSFPAWCVYSKPLTYQMQVLVKHSERNGCKYLQIINVSLTPDNIVTIDKDFKQINGQWTEYISVFPVKKRKVRT